MIFMNVWEKLKKKVEEIPDEKKIRSISIWHFVLVAFIVLWMVGAYVYLDKKTQMSIAAPPVIVLDEAAGITLTNFFQINSTNRQLSPAARNPTKPLFEIREKYFLGDVVVVKYFYVEAIVIGNSAVGDDYVILYKDHNHTLQKISLPRALLMAPADGFLNPVSMLVD